MLTIELTAGDVARIRFALSCLRDAGLVTAHRSGHAVLNLRTPAAETLLASATTG